MKSSFLLSNAILWMNDLKRMNQPVNDRIVSRQLSAQQLHGALIQARNLTQLLLKQWRTLSNDARAILPIHTDWNLPEWEAGHIAWFQEFWIARNTDRSLGCDANPDSARLPSLMPASDGLYHSSLIAHDVRWKLDLPLPQDLERYLNESLKQTLGLLEEILEPEPSSDAHRDRSLYFYRLALYHEDMHAEAALYSMNHYLFQLGSSERMLDGQLKCIESSIRGSGFFDTHARTETEGLVRFDALSVDSGERRFGAAANMGFAFDNECAPFTQYCASFSIDTHPVSVAAYKAFMDAGGYHNRKYWSETGWEWKLKNRIELPRFHRVNQGRLERCCFGTWKEIPLHSPITHVSAHEAEAWCNWADRRLPTEYEWTAAAMEYPDQFHWGQVWEWTQSDFVPFEGFRAHPYRDYSQPWFKGHRVLKGASFVTQERMRHWVYRNFYVPSRNDIYAGFRTCAR